MEKLKRWMVAGFRRSGFSPTKRRPIDTAAIGTAVGLKPDLRIGAQVGAHRLRAAFVLLICLSLAACGFHLRGNFVLPFQTLVISLPDNDEFRNALARAIQGASDTVVVKDAKAAEAVLSVLKNEQTKLIQSLNSAGQVREYRLQRNLVFQVKDARGGELLAPASVSIYRDISYSDALVLSKETEESLLWRDMQNDLVQQVLRRLAAAKRKADE